MRKGQTFLDYKFYDEREWRYVIPPQDDNYIVNKKDFEKWRGGSKKPLLKETLHFKAIDVKYIITSSDNEVEELVKVLFSSKLGTDDEVKKLIPKIITAKTN